MRYKEVKKFTVPPNTYPSVPNLAKKIGIEFEWEEREWEDYYYLGGTTIVDAAVMWKENSYIPNTLMCLSFQYQKHLSLGRGGMILTDNKKDCDELKKMSYDGREWDDFNVYGKVTNHQGSAGRSCNDDGICADSFNTTDFPGNTCKVQFSCTLQPSLMMILPQSPRIEAPGPI